ncbi:MAG: glycosyltransferase family 4 protein [Cyanobacteria bacterium P01_G01_bin.54]
MKKPRLLYASGPCDSLRLYNYYRQGEDDPTHFAVIYTQQFFDACKTLDAIGMAISPHIRAGAIRDQQFTISHWPFFFKKGPAIAYHLYRIWLNLRLVVTALLFRADAVIVVGSWHHIYILFLLTWLGIPVIPDLHTKLWAPSAKRKGLSELILKLNSHLFSHGCQGILVVSDEIGSQIKAVTQNQNKPIHRFFPTYRPHRFNHIKAVNLQASPFVVLYVGRIERNKGVCDLLEVAKRFAAEGQNIVFHLCGTGSELDKLREAAADANLQEQFYCHGHLLQEDLRNMYSQSNVVIAPTTNSFAEGFNKVALEAILAGRPIVTSSACPALADVEAAAMVVPPGDVKAYGNAILKLWQDKALYQAKCESALRMQAQFYDLRQGWQSTLESVLKPLLNGEQA